MKRLLPLLIFLLLCSFSQTSSARMNAYIAGSVASASGGGCSNVPATDYVGLAADSGTADGTTSENYIFCAPYTPAAMTCSTGTLDTFYIDKRYSGTYNAKGCIYNRVGNGATAPEEGDTKLYCTDEIHTEGDAGIQSVAVSGTVNVSSTGTYWICISSDSTRWEGSRTSDTTNGFYCSAISGGSYTSLPSDLSDCLNWSAEGQWGFEARFSIK